MREIKFRAWDNYNKMYIFGEPINFQSFWAVCLENEFNDIEQYIGLKDKNGREIYEGDILEKWTSEYEEWDEEKDEPIPPHRSGFRDNATMERFPRYWLAHESFGYEGEDLEDTGDWEVVGNIHENPELLK